MAVLNREQYIESLRKQKPKVYTAGERVESVVDHPLFKQGINNAAVTFESANDPKFKDLATVESPLINERVSRWTHIVESEQDAIAKVSKNCVVSCHTEGSKHDSS